MLPELLLHRTALQHTVGIQSHAYSACHPSLSLNVRLRRKLGCPEGRSATTWVDYSLFGHQIVCHHVKGYSAAASRNAGA